MTTLQLHVIALCRELTADVKILRIIGRISPNQFKCDYLRNQKLFLKFSLRFWNLRKISNIFFKKDVPHSSSISEIIDSETHACLNVCLLKCLKGPCFRAPCGSHFVNRCEKRQKSARKHFYLILLSLWDKLNCKTSLLVRSEILGLFVKTLTAGYMYSRYNRETFPQPIQMQLSKKPETFSEVFIVFLKWASDFEHFETKRWASELKYFPNY